jgi:hypothetical protein
MFGTWLWGLDKDQKSLVLEGATATCWAIWCCRNDVVFDQKVVPSPLQVIYSAIHWLCTWTVLQKSGARDTILATCRRLEQVLHECFPRLMCDGLVFGLDTTRVWDLFYVSIRLCVSCDAKVGRWCSGKLY